MHDTSFFNLDIHNDLFSRWNFVQIRLHVFSKRLVSAAGITTRLQVGGLGFGVRILTKAQYFIFLKTPGIGPTLELFQPPILRRR